VRLFVGHPASVSRPVVGTRSTILLQRQEKRKVYPYSIVPGGAESVLEARNAMLTPAVAAHYKAFDLGKLQKVTLSTDLVGYVSYRYGDQIYWTAKQIRLKAGETVFTDGEHIARGRCLNCYSAHPMMPIRPHEPTEKTLDSPTEVPLIAMQMMPMALPDPFTLPPTARELSPAIPDLPVVETAHRPVRWWLPILPILPILPFIPPIHHHPNPPAAVVPVPPGGGGGTGGGGGEGGGGGNPPGDVVVPEPGYFGFLAMGFSALVGVHAIRSRRNRRP
jgi:hypothetical protein